MKYLKELCRLNGVSGDESFVRNFILEKIGGKCSVKTDNLGNIIAFKKGRMPTDKKLMITAHMDEVGFIITSVKSDGTLTFEAVGGIDRSVMLGRKVRIGERIGVIGAAPTHKLTTEEKEKYPKTSDMYIDIGAADDCEAKEYIAIGDYACFESAYIETGSDMIISKALDNRVGCAILIALIENESLYDAYYVFTVQEEIGLRGAKVAAFAVEPDIAIVVETTTAADIEGISGAKRVCKLGSGPVVSYMDKSAVYDKDLFNLAFAAAKDNNVKCQTKTLIAGGNDGGVIHLSRGGVRTLAVSVPCRYLHSPSCMICKNDLSATYELIKLMIGKVIENDTDNS